METTKVAVVSFDGISLLPRYFNLSCPFPVSSVEVSLVPEIATVDVQDKVVPLTSSLVENEVVGVVTCKVTPFQSGFQRFTFSQPKNIQGLYSLVTDDVSLKGRVYVIVIMKQ